MAPADPPPLAAAEQLARNYRDNGLRLLMDGQIEKASEMLWGGVAQAIRAAALSRSKAFRTHKGLRLFVRAATKELGKPDLWRDFKAVEALHANFYEGSEEAADVQELAHIAVALMDTFLGLVKIHPSAKPQGDASRTARAPDDSQKAK